jgi:hypothetical protein
MALRDFPLIVLAVSLACFWLAAQAGSYVSRRVKVDEDDRTDLGVVVGAALTLLGLIIGFSFSMAISRYDQRKNYEAEEANAIGTEYLRAGLLPAADAAKTRELLKRYVDDRIAFYTTRDSARLKQIDSSTLQLQNDLWAAVQARAVEQQTALTALVASGMNDVLNSQAYSQAALWNRIPRAAWALMTAVGICCNFLVGYTWRHSGKRKRFFILPAIVAISFFLIADIDSPRGGTIRVRPQNLDSVAATMKPPA